MNIDEQFIVTAVTMTTNGTLHATIDQGGEVEVLIVPPCQAAQFAMVLYHAHRLGPETPLVVRYETAYFGGRTIPVPVFNLAEPGAWDRLARMGAL